MTKRRAAPSDEKLATPIEASIPPAPPNLIEQVGDPASMERWQAEVERWRVTETLRVQQVRLEKLPPLLAEVGVVDLEDPDRWFKLAWSLACQYVPGFSVVDPPARRGRKTDWDEWRQACAAAAVRLQLTRLNAGGAKRSELDACRQLVKREPWEGIEARTLQNQAALGRKGDLGSMLFRIADARGDSWLEEFLAIRYGRQATGPAPSR